MKLYIGFIGLIGLISFTKPVFATPDFSIAFNANYQVQEKGITKVQKKIQLTNLTTNIYPAVYTLEIPEDAFNLVAFDKKGKIEPIVFEEAGRKKVKLPLKEKALGVNKSIQFALQYETQQIAFKKNGYWKIVIPKIESWEEIIGYNVSLGFPENWGNPTFITPQPRENFFWTLKEVKDSPIVVSFEKESKITPLNASNSENNIFPVLLTGILIAIFLGLSLYLLHLKNLWS